MRWDFASIQLDAPWHCAQTPIKDTPRATGGSNQIVAQVPTNVLSGKNVVVVHSLDTAQSSTPVMVTVLPAGAALAVQ